MTNVWSVLESIWHSGKTITPRALQYNFS